MKGMILVEKYRRMRVPSVEKWGEFGLVFGEGRGPQRGGCGGWLSCQLCWDLSSLEMILVKRKWERGVATSSLSRYSPFYLLFSDFSFLFCQFLFFFPLLFFFFLVFSTQYIRTDKGYQAARILINTRFYGTWMLQRRSSLHIIPSYP